MKRIVIGVILLASLVLAGAAQADQKDPRLPALFDQLKSAPDADFATALATKI